MSAVAVRLPVAEPVPLALGADHAARSVIRIRREREGTENQYQRQQCNQKTLHELIPSFK